MVYLDWYCEGCYIISKTCWGAMAAHSCTLISHSAVHCRRRVHRLMGGWAMYLDGQSLAGHRWATHRERTAGPSSSCPSDRPLGGHIFPAFLIPDLSSLRPFSYVLCKNRNTLQAHPALLWEATHSPGFSYFSCKCALLNFLYFIISWTFNEG